ncbi:TetR/AcrR family transcriptional regulator [Nocardia farcinica]|uniref:TetR/AcrR family transcriptional regulator n=1 Tax=Nocardia farcinica TaxID=37329 RepID=UPI002456A96B|nr:TetR family transcriptional regulator [Nocardia farcinica]
MPTRRELLLDAAIDLLGTRGARALTHRAVDDAAGMPAGSASNYFRTRDALLAALAERLEERDHADWTALSRMPAPTTVEQLVSAAATFVGHAVTTDRARTMARYALFLAAQADGPRDAVRRGRGRLTEWAAEQLRGVGADDAVAPILVDYLDGLILHGIVAPDFDPRPGLERIVAALLD